MQLLVLHAEWLFFSLFTTMAADIASAFAAPHPCRARPLAASPRATDCELAAAKSSEWDR